MKYYLNSQQRLCVGFRDIAKLTWNLIRKSFEIGHRIHEETITDLVIIKLRYLAKRTQLFTVKDYNKREEGNTGADWEILVGNHVDEWICIRAQAKIISINENFQHLHYQNSNTKISQNEILQNNTKKDGQGLVDAINRIPAYCFYIYLDKKSRKILQGSSKSQYGCSFAKADDIYKLKGKTKIKDVAPYIFPWHLMFCCNNALHLKIIDTILNTLVVGDKVQQDQFVCKKEKLPRYMKTLLESDTENIALPDRVRRISILRFHDMNKND